jgi:hypothetical protein
MIKNKNPKREITIIIHRSGSRFVLRRLDKEKSPLDVPGVNTGISRQEVINSIREGREMDSQERRSSY